MLKMHKAVLERTAEHSDDATGGRLAEEASWDADFIIRYFESRIKDLNAH